MNNETTPAALPVEAPFWPCTPDASCNCERICRWHPDQRPAEPTYYWKHKDHYYLADPQPSLYSPRAPVQCKATARLPVEALAPSDEQMALVDALCTAAKDYGVAMQKTPGFTTPQRTVMLETRERLLATMLSPPAVLVEPAGWVLVPIEPTGEMIDAAAIYRHEAHMLDRPLVSSKLWAAMLAAAPPDAYLKGSGG